MVGEKISRRAFLFKSAVTVPAAASVAIGAGFGGLMGATVAHQRLKETDLGPTEMDDVLRKANIAVENAKREHGGSLTDSEADNVSENYIDQRFKAISSHGDKVMGRDVAIGVGIGALAGPVLDRLITAICGDSYTKKIENERNTSSDRDAVAGRG